MANNRQTQWIVQYMFLFAQLFHAFILTVQGQFVINGLQDVYNSMWANVNIESLISINLFLFFFFLSIKVAKYLCLLTSRRYINNIQ